MRQPDSPAPVAVGEFRTSNGHIALNLRVSDSCNCRVAQLSTDRSRQRACYMNTGMRGSILVIEDHELMRNALRDSLSESFLDWQILTAGTGEEGLALFREHRPRVVVMDLNLPGITGIEATRQIKALLPATAIVMCSLSDDPAQRVAASEAGADEWIPKDVAFDVLVPAVRRHLIPLPPESQNSDECRKPGPLPAASSGRLRGRAEWPSGRHGQGKEGEERAATCESLLSAARSASSC
jgi:CheY-like chemotaxis protein